MEGFSTDIHRFRSWPCANTPPQGMQPANLFPSSIRERLLSLHYSSCDQFERQKHGSWPRSSFELSLDDIHAREPNPGIEPDGVRLGLHEDADAPVLFGHLQR